MQQIKYDAYLMWFVSTFCNLSCAYCSARPTVKQQQYSDEQIDIPAIMKVLNSSGRIFKITFSGGEPFLIKNIVQAFSELTKKHYISVITNLTSNKITEFVREIDPERTYGIITSLHIMELEKYNLIPAFINHYHLLKDNKFNPQVNIVGYPWYKDKAEKYRTFFNANGINIFFTPFRGKWKGKLYPNSYTDKELKLFGISKEFALNLQNRKSRGKVCTAGYNMGIVKQNGDIYACFEHKKKIGSIYKGIHFFHKIIKCPFEQCGCPLMSIENHLYKETIKKNQIQVDAGFFEIHSPNTGPGTKDENKVSRNIAACVMTTTHLIAKQDSIRKDSFLYECIRLLGSSIIHARSALPVLKDGQYDIIHIIGSHEDMQLPGMIRNIIGKNAKTKLLLSIDNIIEDFNPETISSIFALVDIVFTRNSLPGSIPETVQKSKICIIKEPGNMKEKILKILCEKIKGGPDNRPKKGKES